MPGVQVAEVAGRDAGEVGGQARPRGGCGEVARAGDRLEARLEAVPHTVHRLRGPAPLAQHRTSLELVESIKVPNLKYNSFIKAPLTL